MLRPLCWRIHTFRFLFVVPAPLGHMERVIHSLCRRLHARRLHARRLHARWNLRRLHARFSADSWVCPGRTLWQCSSRLSLGTFFEKVAAPQAERNGRSHRSVEFTVSACLISFVEPRVCFCRTLGQSPPCVSLDTPFRHILPFLRAFE